MANKKPSTSKKSAKPIQKPRKLEKKMVETFDIDPTIKVQEGWIHVNSMIEVMAAKKDVVEASLKEHLGRIEAEKGILIVKKTFSTVEKVENPPRNVPEAYSQFVEMELLVRNMSMLVYYVFTFGPAAIEVLAPNEIKIKQGEAQDIANALASLIHQFASQGAGGVVISKKNQ